MQSQHILSPESCFEIIKKKLSLNSIDNFKCKYKFEPRNKFAGFLGQYYDLKVTVRNRETGKVKYLNFFVKLYPAEGPQSDFVREGACFENELSLYIKIFPKLLSRVENESIPECFLGIKDSAIVLENMDSRGFKMLEKLDFLDFQHCAVVVKYLARFHARSIIFEEKNKTTVLSICQNENIAINLCDETFQSTLNYFSENLILLLDFLGDMDPAKKEKYKSKISQIARKHFERTSSLKNQRNVLCHADLWTNNILFKYDKNDIQVDQCCVIDFQMARYCSPACDLLYFVHCTTSRTFRRENLDNLLKIYHETLTESLKEANLDINGIFSYDLWQESVSEIKLSCMIQAYATMTVSLLGLEASIQRTEDLLPLSKIICNEFKFVDNYRKRMIDNLLDLCTNLDDTNND